MKLTFISNHSKEKRYQRGFKKIEKRFLADPSVKKCISNGCIEMIADLTTGEMSFIYSDGQIAKRKGLLKEK